MVSSLNECRVWVSQQPGMVSSSNGGRGGYLGNQIWYFHQILGTFHSNQNQTWYLHQMRVGVGISATRHGIIIKWWVGYLCKKFGIFIKWERGYKSGISAIRYDSLIPCWRSLKNKIFCIIYFVLYCICIKWGDMGRDVSQQPYLVASSNVWHQSFRKHTLVMSDD